jgi:hypothetical protein
MEKVWLDVLEVVGGFVFGGGLTFVGMLLKHKWEKQEKQDKISLAIAAVSAEVSKTNDKIDGVKDSIMGELGKEREEKYEYRAKLCRQRILQFNDELYRNKSVLFTRESFDDVISDIDAYEDYCDAHPDFPNFKAVAAIKNIKDTYAKCLADGNFLA